MLKKMGTHKMTEYTGYIINATGEEKENNLEQQKENKNFDFFCKKVRDALEDKIKEEREFYMMNENERKNFIKQQYKKKAEDLKIQKIQGGNFMNID
jgi:hypothetical protein